MNDRPAPISIEDLDTDFRTQRNEQLCAWSSDNGRLHLVENTGCFFKMPFLPFRANVCYENVNSKAEFDRLSGWKHGRNDHEEGTHRLRCNPASQSRTDSLPSLRAVGEKQKRTSWTGGVLKGTCKCCPILISSDHYLHNGNWDPNILD